ncbi:hypothetical protein DAEQUDRAFT_813557 [Daedalea quercina L-15889]|uniref:DUF6534 domain-containing protein n=1 Tax=Daedalea quercina L-15889 TaxID=1314783 RepID=A0A165N2U2_9APHY|nr:hypothetical protein DAEQUDRAFT_813557 [Daedalea quercina L-15889]
MTDQLNLITGPQLIGAFFNWGLIGVLNVQAYLYYTYFPNDRWSFKLMVYGIVIFEWVHTALVTSGLVTIYVYDFGDSEAPTGLHSSWFAVPIMCALVSMFVQIFFSWRIYMFSRSYWMAGAVVMIRHFKAAEDVTHGSVLPIAVVWLCGASAVDIMIAALMTFLLLKSRNGIPRSDALINRAVQMVVETGILTAGCAVIMLALAKAPQTRNTLLYEVISLTITTLYANTFLTNLNSRARIQEGLPRVQVSLGSPLGSAKLRGTTTVVPSNFGTVSYEMPSFHKTYDSGCCSVQSVPVNANTPETHSTNSP